jgi:hypothetical protein
MVGKGVGSGGPLRSIPPPASVPLAFVSAAPIYCFVTAFRLSRFQSGRSHFVRNRLGHLGPRRDLPCIFESAPGWGRAGPTTQLLRQQSAISGQFRNSKALTVSIVPNIGRSIDEHRETSSSSVGMAP